MGRPRAGKRNRNRASVVFTETARFGDKGHGVDVSSVGSVPIARIQCDPSRVADRVLPDYGKHSCSGRRRCSRSAPRLLFIGDCSDERWFRPADLWPALLGQSLTSLSQMNGSHVFRHIGFCGRYGACVLPDPCVRGRALFEWPDVMRETVRGDDLDIVLVAHDCPLLLFTRPDTKPGCSDECTPPRLSLPRDYCFAPRQVTLERQPVCS